jgi:hypothetical protein
MPIFKTKFAPLFHAKQLRFLCNNCAFRKICHFDFLSQLCASTALSTPANFVTQLRTNCASTLRVVQNWQRKGVIASAARPLPDNSAHPLTAMSSDNSSSPNPRALRPLSVNAQRSYICRISGTAH